MKRVCHYLILLLPFLMQGCSNNYQAKDETLSSKKDERFFHFANAPGMMDDWSKENILVIHTLSDVGYLHPTNYSVQNARLVLGLTHPALLTIDQVEGKLSPCLAKGLPEADPDGLKFTYALLDEAVWDDGSPVTSEDVVFTFKVCKCKLTDNAMHKPFTVNLLKIEQDTAHPKRFTMVMKAKYVQAVSMVTDFPVISRHYFDPQQVMDKVTMEQLDDPNFKADEIPAIKEWFANFNDGKNGNVPQNFYGCGAYKVTAWDRGQSITLEKKTNHWTDHLQKENIYLHGYPQKIIFKAVKDENASMLEFKSQAMDASTFINSRLLIELQKDSLFNRNYHSVFLNSYNFTYIGMNMRPDGVKHKKILDDVSVRRAIAMVTPVDRLIEVIVLGRARRWTTMVSPLKPEFNADLTQIPYDVATASKLLEDAGWIDSDGDNIRDKIVDGERIPLQLELLSFTQGNMVKEMISVIVEGAYPAGVKIIPKLVETSVLRQLVSDHDFDLELSSWAISSLPEDYSQLWSTKSWVSKGSNYSGFGNAESDALIDSISATLNDAQRIPMVRRLQKMVYDAQPYVFLYSPDRKVVIHKRFGNAIATSEQPSFIPNNLVLLSGGVGSLSAEIH